MGTDRHGTDGDGEGSDRRGAAPFALRFDAIDPARVDLAGGKAANLAAVASIEGVDVPPGFCVTTAAFRRHVSGVPSFDERLRRLSRLDPTDRDAIRTLSANLRAAIEATPIPSDVVAAITEELDPSGRCVAYAVRSSATAEDAPGASSAGQHDSFLEVARTDAVLDHVRRVWASLFTERAVTYRLRDGGAPGQVEMAVVVQAMVAAEASGVLFTADPMTSNRRHASVEAVPGLGEALVSGRVNPEVFEVRGDEVASRSSGASTMHDTQLLELVRLGRRIEARFGCPQDVEWCRVGDRFAIVQSRPITTLFPIPAAADDGSNHVYLSVGHQQMMTDAMKPLGWSVHQLIAMVPMHEAGGRLFVDVTPRLSTSAGRDQLMSAFATADPLTLDALRTVLERDDFVPLGDDEPLADATAPAPPASAPIEPDGALVDELVERLETSLAELRREIRTREGADLFDFIRDDIDAFKRVVFDPRGMQVIMAAMNATLWLNERLETWLEETNASDVLTQSVAGNITSEMGLALLDVADVIRPYPEVVAFLGAAPGDGFMDALPELAGGPVVREAIGGFLDRFGMRCAGEIDITRPRWSEQPSTLLPVLLGNVRNVETGAGQRRFEQGRREAAAAEERLLTALRALPDGAPKADDTERMIHRLRTFSGYREYPKYAIVSRHLVYKQALLGEAARFARAGALDDADDVFHLTFAEFREAARSGTADRELIARRKAEFRANEALTPPRVLTSDGEVLSGSYDRTDAPPGALVGLAVSGGTVEGRARVILDLAEADLEPGDILVTTFTDPSWTPVFVGIEGLVTEVGGLMTHGAVIAREYGLPAVVGVTDATRLIRDGQRIRVHGTAGYVEVLDELPGRE